MKKNHIKIFNFFMHCQKNFNYINLGVFWKKGKKKRKKPLAKAAVREQQEKGILFLSFWVLLSILFC